MKLLKLIWKESRWKWFIASAAAFLILSLLSQMFYPGGVDGFTREDVQSVLSGFCGEMGISDLTIAAGYYRLIWSITLIPGTLCYIGLLPLHHRQGPYPERIIRIAIILTCTPVIVSGISSFCARLAH